MMFELKKGMSSMFLCEMYRSIQGEGLLTGQPSVFVRTAGCNLRCWFCDTPYSSWKPEGTPRSIEEIVAFCSSEGDSHVVLTGGEPMLQPEVVALTRQLSAAGKHVTIETAGTISRDVACDLMSISPKRENSTPSVERAGDWSKRHEAARHQPDVLRTLMTQYDYQLKFVVDQPVDCDDVLVFLNEFPEAQADRVLLMPQGVALDELQQRESWLRPFCEQQGFRLCSRKHIEWYGNQRGT